MEGVGGWEDGSGSGGGRGWGTIWTGCSTTGGSTVGRMGACPTRRGATVEPRDSFTKGEGAASLPFTFSSEERGALVKGLELT